MCDQELLLAVDVEAPYYVVELLFTYSSLFQVVPAVDGVMASTKPQKIIFNTPDCYEATKDADFCAKQDVKYCGAPRDLRVLNVTEFLKTQLVSPYFEWLSPIQINADYKLLLYSVTINWANGTKVQGDTVKHETNKTKHSWIADQTGFEDWEIQEGALYVFKVTPMVYSPNFGTNEGVTGELKFWANITDVVTAAPTTTDAPIYITNPPSRTGLVINLVIVFCLIVVAILIFAIIAKRKGLFEMDTGEEVFYRIDRAKTNIYTEPLMRVDPVLKPKEVNHDKITLQQELGKGQFGIVYKGLVYGISGDEEYVEAAVKTTKDGAFDDVKEDLLEEMKLMIQLGSHPNLMTLLACCTQREPYYLITEFMEYGDLLNFLRRCREKENGEKDNIYNVGEMEQLGIAHQIAKGMAYVQEERYYHGDLAARNVLVGRGLTIKISDFGLADDIYSRGYKRREQEQKIPIKWCSIEAILNGICSSEGDVWSYGVVLYEIFTLGGTPYPGIAGRFLVAQLREGYRMDQPEGCPDEIYKIMLQCWEEVAESRPRFNDISQSVDAMLVERSDYLCFDMEGECEDNAEDGSSRPLSVPNIYVRAPGNLETSENFAPIIEEDNEIGLEELQEIIHSENKADIKRDANDNV
ncbi:fibroblast growth factor receptor-like isoform X3 [Apostichopus japonicus]